MLKFSGFADLTSCLESLQASTRFALATQCKQLSAHNVLNKLIAAARHVSITCLTKARAHREAQGIAAARARKEELLE